MKKIILSAIFTIAIIIQSVVSAADFDSINWDKVPHISNKEDFIKYILYCEKNCRETIPVVFENGLLVKAEEFLRIAKNTRHTTISGRQDFFGQTTQAIYELNIYPGAKVAYAYDTGDTSILSADERKLYNVAVEIVNEANEQPTALLKELFIHDAITARTSYLDLKSDDPMPQHCTAIGALIDGQANCQGYSDAFYMLGSMCGFKISKMQGKANNSDHVWNTIEFGDGKIYGVDVTWDDAAFTDNSNYNNYIYFNAPKEIIQSTHAWYINYSPNLQPTVDDKYFYCTQEFYDTDGEYFAFYADSADDALNYIAHRIADEGKQISRGMSRYNSRYANLEYSLNRLLREILPKQYNWYGKIKLSVTRRGNYLFYIVDAVKN